MKTRTSMLALLFVSFLGGGCTPRGPGGTTSRAEPTAEPPSLVVFAAASLTDAFQEMGRGFEEAHPGVNVDFNFAGSQTLRAQIQEGARADVFASAHPAEMESLETAGDLAAPARTFATNLLTIIVAPGNPAGIASAQDLAHPGVKLVLAAEEVPVGAYARQALVNLAATYGAGYPSAVLQNVVSNEDNVKQVVAKVRLGEADAGIVYESDAVGGGSWETVSIPGPQNVTADYPIAVLAQGRDLELASEFVEYVLSGEGQAVLARWGFGPPP